MSLSGIAQAAAMECGNEEQIFFTPVPVRIFRTPCETSAPGRKPKDRMPFDKKHENARQSILRYFKKNMRKLLKVCKTTGKGSKIQASHTFHKMYPQTSEDQFEQMKYLLSQIGEPELLRSDIKAKGFKSCCNAYVQWLFDAEVTRALYELHTHLAAITGGFDKVLRLSPQTTEAQRSKLLEFAYTIPLSGN